MTDDDRPRSVDWLTPNYPWADDPIPGSFHRTQARAVVRAGVGVRVGLCFGGRAWWGFLRHCDGGGGAFGFVHPQGRFTTY